MVRVLASFLVASLLGASLAGPSLAQDAGAPAAKPSSSTGGSGTPIAKRLVAFTVGFVGGVPVAMVRKSIEATVDGTKDICGQSTNPIFLVPAGALSLPFGVLSGMLQSPMVSAYNAWKYSDDEPFGKASFSLGEGD